MKFTDLFVTETLFLAAYLWEDGLELTQLIRGCLKPLTSNLKLV